MKYYLALLLTILTVAQCLETFYVVKGLPAVDMQNVLLDFEAHQIKMQQSLR